MTPVVAVLLLSVAGLAEEPATTPQAAPATPQAAAQQPPAKAPEAEPATTAPATGPAAAPAPGKPMPSVDAVTSGRPAARILPLDPRLEAYAQFREFYEAARYQDALPYAKRVVELSEADTKNDYELPIAYNNLGATQYQLGEYAAAESSYKKSLDVLEASQGIASRRLVVPLAGLGAVYAALDHHARAVEMFERAIAVSRRSDGLFNQNQLALLEQSADSRTALEDLNGIERDRYYALRIAEQNYGYGDPHTLDPAIRLARFYEEAQEFTAARAMWLRVRDISLRDSSGLTPLAVRSLIAICRTHRLQYTIDPETLDDEEAVRDPITGELLSRGYRSTHVPAPQANRAGLKSAEKALELLRATPSPPPDLLTETLIELGDWFQATARPNVAMPYYAEASTIFARHTEALPVNPLLEPRMIFYRPPLAAKRGSAAEESGDAKIRSTTFEFAVSETGDTRDITVVSTDMLDGQLAQSRRAITRAVYSPRFENGRAVATQGVRFTGIWYEDLGARQDASEPAEDPSAGPEEAPPATPEKAEPARPGETPPASAAGN